MNYCRQDYIGNGNLSSLDVLAVESYYGKKLGFYFCYKIKGLIFLDNRKSRSEVENKKDYNDYNKLRGYYEVIA